MLLFSYESGSMVKPDVEMKRTEFKNRGKGMKRGNSSLKRGKIKPRKWSKTPTVDGNSERAIRDECDALTRTIVLLREKECFITGCCRTDLQCGHLFERRHQTTRYDVHPLGNNHAQCSFHNQLHEDNPHVYRNEFIRRCGAEAYAILAARKDLPIKRTYTELISIRDELRREAARVAR